MSSIEKLSIRGIRSFSPNREEIIEFYHPLTVILGENGCGKTTVIECLKIACTGSLPPGARGGQSFVHDPKIEGTNQVKASIRLRFCNRAGKQMVVQRTYQLQQLKTNMRYKAMDGAIRVVNELGEKVSMSHKCMELDRHIPELLGVSKAILESVIFCHQEESNWPLMEGATLKKRFDDIFESARYTKALDAIRKLRKARNTDTKDFKRDLEVLSVKMKTAEGIRDKINKAQTRLDDVLQESEQLNEKVDRAEEKLKEQEQLLEEIKAHCSSLERSKLDASQKEESIQRAYANIEQMMSDTDEELEALLNNYDAIINGQLKEFQGLQEQESQYVADKKRLQKNYSDLCTSKGNVEAKVEANQLQVTELVDMVAKFGAKYNIYLHPLPLQAEDIQAFLAKFKGVVNQKQDSVQQREFENQQAEDVLTAELSELKAKLHHNREEYKAKMRELGDINTDKRKMAIRLKELSGMALPSQRDVTEMDILIQKAENSLQTHKEQHNVVNLKDEIQLLNRKLNDANFEIEQLDEKIGVLRLHEREHISLDAKQTEYRSKIEDFNFKLAEKASEFQEILGAKAPTDRDSLVAAIKIVDDLLVDHKQNYDQTKRELTQAEQKLQENMVSSKLLEKNLTTLRSEKNELEQSQVVEMKKMLEEVLPGEDLKNAEQGVQKLEKAYFDAKDKTLRCKNTIAFLNIFKQKGEKEHCCPLCQRGMSAEEEQIFIKAIIEKTDDKKIHDKIKKAEAQESIAYNKWKEMENYIPSWQKWMRLESQISEKNKELNELYMMQKTLQVEVRDKKHHAELAQRQFEETQRVNRELGNFGEIMNELNRTYAKIIGEEERLKSMDEEAVGPGNPSLANVQSVKDTKQAEVQELNRQVQRKQSELQRIQDMQQQLQNDLHTRKQEKLKMEEQRKDYEAAIDEQNKLREREKALRDATLKLTDAEGPLEHDVKKKEAERESGRAEATTEQRKLRLELQQHQEDLHIFSDKCQIIERQEITKLERELQQLEEQIAQIKQQQITADQALEELSPQITRARQHLDQQETFKRHIRGNLEYRNMMKELESIRAKIENIKQKLNELPPIADVDKRVQTSKAAVGAVRDSRAILQGRKQQLDEQIREYKVQLRAADLRNVEEKYRQKYIQYETTTMAVEDLDKYYKALDQSLLQYHSKKVEEINTIIRSLWQVTYRGQDIDTIELVSGQQSAEGTAKTTTRSYDYRVVMKKGGAMIDMRGRCSAGQKVLAALVIRLALAETFCLNCGILTLDEPTTNLDTENKYGLAQAITDILNARAGQLNFQLVCITHDEEFVHMLSQTQALSGSRPEYYWRISREHMGNNRYYSKIERRDWRDGN